MVVIKLFITIGNGHAPTLVLLSILQDSFALLSEVALFLDFLVELSDVGLREPFRSDKLVDLNGNIAKELGACRGQLLWHRLSS